MRTIIVLLTLTSACADVPGGTPEDGLAASNVAIISPLVGLTQGGWVPRWTGPDGPPICMQSINHGGMISMPMPLIEGDRMLSLTMSAASETETADMAIETFHIDTLGQVKFSTVGSLRVVDVPLEFVDYTLDVDDRVVADGIAYWVAVYTLDPFLCINSIRLTYDHPVAP